MKKYLFVCGIWAMCNLVSCTGSHTYTIGVSQCQDDAWRQKMNAEMQRELLYHPEMHLKVRDACCDNELQCAQIDSFVKEGVDLLIVSPNEAEAVKPAVSRAYKAGIPVIVADRRVTGEEWTAFVGGDNLAVGRMMGSWVKEKEVQAGRRLKVIEIVGLPGSTPAVLRHQGLCEVIDSTQIIAIGQGKWLQADARHAMDSLLKIFPDVDIVLAQNDLMAIGASEALRARHMHASVMGVDGINLGLKALVDGRIEATTTYASRGDMVIQTAAQILEGHSFVRDTVLQTTIIDAHAAEAMLQANEQNAHDVATIQFLQGQIDALGERSQRRTVWLIIIGLFFLIAILMEVQYILKNVSRIKEETEGFAMDAAEIASPKGQDDTLTPKLKAFIDAHLSDPDLSVELLSEEMGMSRAQLFRRIKALSGKAPVEIIRERRLKKARELLQSTDMNVQQVAYEVGFTSPSYFTKCYKDQYGESPKSKKQ